MFETKLRMQDFVDVSENRDRTSPVWQYFLFNKSKNQALCKKCPTPKIITIEKACTQLLRNHLKKHQIFVESSKPDKKRSLREAHESSNSNSNEIEEEDYGNQYIAECDFCDKVFDKNANLEYHVQEFHSKGDSEQKCVICQKEFQHFAELEDHFKHDHAQDSKPYRCFICNRNFKYQLSCQAHQFCHENVSKCVICDFSFDIDQLMDHLKKKHDATFPECNLCNQVCKNNKALK